MPTNPYAFREKGEKILEWGFLNSSGRLITEPRGNKSSLDHEKLARKVLNVTEHEALTDKGYTRLLVSQWDTGWIQVGFEFYGYDVRPLKAIRRYLDETEIPVQKVEIMAKEYNLEDVVPEGRFYGSPEKTIGWLRSYTPPPDEDQVEEEENPTRIRNGPYRHDSQSRDFGFISPRGKVHSGKDYPGVTGHWDLAPKVIKGAVADELMLKGYIRFAVLRNGEGLFDVYSNSSRGVKTGLATVAKYLKTSPLVTGEVNLDIFWGDYAKPMWDKRYEDAEAVLRDIRKLSQLTPTELRKMIYDPTGKHRDYLEEKYTDEYEQERNPAPRRPGEKDRRWPFKLIQAGQGYTAEMNDLSRFNVSMLGDGTWRWAPINTSHWSETFNTLEGALLNLEEEAESHTGRLGGTMKFIIMNQTGRVVGTVAAPNRRAARDRLRGHLKALGFRTAQEGFLYPYISAAPEMRYVADQGAQIK